MNAVSLYVEHGEQTFERVHVTAAAELARAARNDGVSQFIQISGIGSDPESESKYIRARGRGEAAVKAAFPGSHIVRPAVMMGPDDVFLTTIVRLIRLLPIYPLFGDGGTRLQPVYVEDVAEAVTHLFVGGASVNAPVFEFGGARIYTYKQLIREIGQQLGARVRMIPMPFAVWSVLASMAEILPTPPITRNQIGLMRHDNVTAADMPGLQTLGIAPRDVDEVIQTLRQRT